MYFERLAQIESGNDPLAKNPNSSAKGKYQFIDSTAQAYGITAEFGTPEYTRQEEEAIVKLTEDNHNALRKGLGREPTDGELYLAHQQGANGALKLLKDPHKKAVDVLGNDEIKLNGGNENMTTGQFAEIWTSKFGGRDTLAGGQGGDTLGRIVNLPDGRSISLTGNETPEQLEALKNKLKEKYAEQNTVEPTANPEIQEEKAGFLGRVADDFLDRYDAVQKSKAQHESGQTSVLNPIASVVRHTAGTGLDVLGEVVNSVTPQSVKDLGSAALKTAGKLPSFGEGNLGQEITKDISKLSGGFKRLEDENPTLANVTGAAANSLLLLTPSKAKPKAMKPTPLKKASVGLESLAKKQQQKAVNKLSDTLVIPKQTPKQKALQATRTTEKGVFGKRVVELTKEQEGMSKVLATLPLNPKKSVQHNLNITHSSALTEAKNLKKALSKNEVVFPRKEILARLKKEKAGLAEDLILNGNTAKQADIITNNFERILKEHPSTGSGLLAARKEFDGWLKAKKAKVFTGGSEGAFEIGSKRIRNLANDFLDEKATNVAVKDSLRKQSNLFKAVDVMADKAAAEASTNIRRAVQNITSVVPLKGEFMQTLGALGIAAGAGSISPAVGTGLIGLYTVGKAGQFVLSPKAKTAVSKLLSVTDDVIRATKDKQIIEKLRLDRATLVEILNEEEEE